MSTYWKAKVAVITGASSGIGARIAVKLADAGVNVIGLARRTELIDNLNSEVDGDGKIFSHHCDLTNEDSILEAFNWINSIHGTISILICNAGIIKANFLTESSSQDIKELYNLNVYSTTICLREGLKLMRAETTASRHIIVMNRMANIMMSYDVMSKNNFWSDGNFVLNNEEDIYHHYKYIK